MNVWQQLGDEISAEYKAMGLFPEQVARQRNVQKAKDPYASDIFGSRSAVASCLRPYSFEALTKRPTQPTLVVGPDDNPIADSELARNIEEKAMSHAKMIAEDSRQIELTAQQRKWSERILAGSGMLLKIFGVEPQNPATTSNIHLISHQDFQRNVPEAQQDGEGITARPGVIQGAMTTHRQMYIDASQNLQEYIHSLTHEAGHANSRLIVKAHRLPQGDDETIPVSYKRMGLRTNEGESAADIHAVYELLDEGIVELFAILSRVHLYLEHQEELTDALGQDGVENLLVTYSDLNIGLQLILGVIEHIAKSLHTSPVHILIAAMQSLNTDSDAFYQMMEQTLSSDFLQPYREGRGDPLMLAHRNGYIADFPENKPYQNGTLEQAIRFMVTRKVQMQIEGLIAPID